MERVASKVYPSLPGVRCSFRGGCGTPFSSCEDERIPGEVYVPVGVFGARNYSNLSTNGLSVER